MALLYNNKVTFTYICNMPRLLAIFLSIVITSFSPAEVVKHNGCYKSVSVDLEVNSKYYLRFYNDGSVIEYENPPQIKISFDKGTLARVMRKGPVNEQFPLKTGSYFIKGAAIKVILNTNGETVTYEGTITKRSFVAQRYSTRTNERADMEFTFIRIKGMK